MDTDKYRWKSRLRKTSTLLGVSLFVYVFLYILNSIFGGYWLKPEMDGHDRYSFGLSMPTAILWQPVCGHEAIGNYDWLGIFYRPLIRLDRQFVHPTIYLSSDDGFEEATHLPISKVHPSWRDEFRTKIVATAVKDETNMVLLCSFNYSGSDFPREIFEIKIKRTLADSLAMSAPDGFVEKPYAGSSQFLKTNYVYWAGKMPLKKNLTATLLFPVQRFSGSTGEIIFYYERSDHAADSRNMCRVELK